MNKLQMEKTYKSCMEDRRINHSFYARAKDISSRLHGIFEWDDAVQSLSLQMLRGFEKPAKEDLVESSFMVINERWKNVVRDALRKKHQILTNALPMDDIVLSKDSKTFTQFKENEEAQDIKITIDIIENKLKASGKTKLVKIIDTLKMGYNKSECAEVLHMNRMSFYKYLKEIKTIFMENGVY